MVSNAFGSVTSVVATLTVTAGQPPVATITQPLAGTFYNAGDTINFAGTGVDQKDGDLPPSNFVWQVDFQHDTHAHPFIPPTRGITNGTFVIPTSGETSPHVWYRIYLTVKDSLGLTNGTYREVLPHTATITLQTSPAGLQVKLDGEPTATSTSVVGVVGLTRGLEAFPQTVGNTSYVFDHWSDGGAAAHNISFPAAATIYTAFYRVNTTSDLSVGYWKFDEASGLTAIDSSPTGNHGTLQGGVTRVAGKINAALGFDGLTGYVGVGADLNQWLGGTASLSAWIKTTQIGKGDFFRSPGITGVESAGDNNDIFWGWLDATGRIALQAGNGDSARSLNPINDGQWHHVGLTRDANTGQVKVYVDGALNATATSEPGIKTTKFFSLGRIEVTGGSANFFQGQLDEVRIYNYVLSASDIQALANPAPPNQPPTITQPPANQMVLPGQPATFTVVATGTQPLVYQWQRDAADVPGATSSGYTLASTTLADSGAQFRCAVSNAFGSITSAAATLTVTNDHPPVATITQPAAGTFYNAGDTVNFAGTGVDQEDGTLSASALTWKVDVSRNGQVSPVVPPTSGINGSSFFVPTAGITSTDVWYRISLTARDSLNQTNTAVRDLLPRTATIILQTSPAGLQIKLDGQPTATATSIVGVVGLTRSLEAFAQTTGGTSYAFDHWSDGSAAAHNILFPSATTTYTAFYRINAVLDQYVGYWKFDEATGVTAFDSSPTANHGTLQAGSTWVSGRINSGLSFDGLTGYVRVGADLNQWLGGTASLSAWIKTTQFGKGDFFRSPGITGVESAGDGNDIFWGWLDATGRIAVQAGNGDSARSLNPINDGAWHHVGLTRDANTGQVKVYVDGVLNATAISETGLKTTKFYSLGRIEASGSSWQGALDEVRIYNFVLGASDMQTLAGLGITQTVARFASNNDGNSDGILSEWRQKYFGHPSAQSADLSGAGDDADGDGQNNLAEFLAGTDPTEATSCFRILSVTQEGNDIRVTWMTGLGKTNALQRAAGDSGTYDFTDIFTVTNTVDSVTNYLDVGAVTNAPSLFYRSRLVP